MFHLWLILVLVVGSFWIFKQLAGFRSTPPPPQWVLWLLLLVLLAVLAWVWLGTPPITITAPK